MHRSGVFASILLAVALLAGGGAAAQPVPDATARVEPLAPTAAPQLPAAGTIPSSVWITVTGEPADGVFLESLIRAALDRRIRPTLRPGASIRYGSIVPWPLLPLQPGDRAAANVAVTIAGDRDSSWVSGTVTVNMVNQAVPLQTPSTLFYSDDPEYATTEGLLFRGAIEAGRTTRLYYYHSNVGLPRDLDVVLTAKTPTRVQAIAAAAGPDLDVMSVGHSVSRDLVLYRQRNQGVLLDVVPGSPLVLRHDLMFQSELVAGAVDLHVLGGGPLTVSVVASPAGGRPQPYLNGPRLAYDGHNRHGAFDLDGFGDLKATYTVGGPDVSITYGSSGRSPRNLDPSDAGRNYGGYGVTYRMTFTLTNPTQAPAVVYLFERPRGGAVRSTFLVDGQLKEVGCARLAQPYWFMTYSVPPGTTGDARLVTMADGGSFYPLEIGVTQTAPVWNTPPVGATDGCSPARL